MEVHEALPEFELGLRGRGLRGEAPRCMEVHGVLPGFELRGQGLRGEACGRGDALCVEVREALPRLRLQALELLEGQLLQVAVGHKACAWELFREVPDDARS